MAPAPEAPRKGGPVANRCVLPRGSASGVWGCFRERSFLDGSEGQRIRGARLCGREATRSYHVLPGAVKAAREPRRTRTRTRRARGAAAREQRVLRQQAVLVPGKLLVREFLRGAVAVGPVACDAPVTDLLQQGV